MATVIQTVQLPDGTLQDVEVPEEWTPDQIRTNLRGSDFFTQNFPAATADEQPAEDPGVAQRFAFGALQQSGLIEEAANLIEQKVTPKQPAQQVPATEVDLASEIPTPPGEQPVAPGSLGTATLPGFEIPAVTEESIRARQDADKTTALRSTFPDIAGTEFENTTAAEVGRVARLMTDLLTFPLPTAQSVQLANQVRSGARILGTSAGRAQLARAATEAGVGVGLFGAADETIRNLADTGAINPGQVGTAMLIAGAGGAIAGPLLAAGGGKFARWLDQRVAKGDRLAPIQVRKDVEAATGRVLSREEAQQLIEGIERTTSNTKVEREQLDQLLGVQPQDKKATKARRAQARAAFKEDPGMADQLARDADEITAVNAINAAKASGPVRDQLLDGAFQRAGGTFEGRGVDIDQLRAQLPNLSRAEQDELLARAQQQGRGAFYAQENPRALRPATREAALNVAGEDLHRIYLESPASIPDKIVPEAIKRRERAKVVVAQGRNELSNTQARPEAVEATEQRVRSQEGAGLQAGTRIPRTKEGKVRGFWKPLNDVIGRIENLSPELAIGVRRVTQRTASNSADSVNRIDRFYKSPQYEALRRKDKQDLAKALRNEDLSQAHGIMAKSPGLNELYNENIFKMLSETQPVRRAGGAEGFRASFMPRLVKSVPKLRRRMGREQRSRLDNLVAAAERQKGRPLDEFELAGIYNQVIGGRPLKTDRSRRIKEIKDQDHDLYEDNRDALISYMHRHAENVATRDFFKENLGRDVPLGQSVDENNIGKLLADARMSGNLQDSDISELADLLGSHFGVARQGPSVARRRFKDLFTGATLGFNPSSTVTQIGDIAPVLNRMGVRNTVSALLGPKRVNVYDVGVREAAKELRTPRGTAKFVRSGLKAMGFDQLDKLAGNTAVNASLKKWFNNAKKNPAATRKELEPLYGEGTDALMVDLADRKISDDVKTLLLWDVGKIRPVGREDMPLSFQKNPNGRVYYSLLSWTLKQLNFLRNEAVADIGKGKVVKGTKDIIKLGLLMGMANMPANVVKDVLTGRDVEPEQSFVEGMLSLGMTSKFIIDALNRGQGEAAIASAVPVLGITGDAAVGVWQALRDGDPVKFLTATPTGRALHNIFGNGTAGDLASSIGSVVIPEAGAAVNEVPDGETDPAQAVLPPTARDVPRDVIKSFENPRQVGRQANGLWLPHKSIEGGTDTLGYGHKLTAAENSSGKLRIDGEPVSYTHLTLPTSDLV